MLIWVGVKKKASQDNKFWDVLQEKWEKSAPNLCKNSTQVLWQMWWEVLYWKQLQHIFLICSNATILSINKVLLLPCFVTFFKRVSNLMYQNNYWTSDETFFFSSSRVLRTRFLKGSFIVLQESEENMITPFT